MNFEFAQKESDDKKGTTAQIEKIHMSLTTICREKFKNINPPACFFYQKSCEIAYKPYLKSLTDHSAKETFTAFLRGTEQSNVVAFELCRLLL